MFNQETIKKKFSSYYYEKGLTLFEKKKVLSLIYNESDNTFEAKVKASNNINYFVNIKCNDKTPIEAKCNCYYTSYYTYNCEHCIASLLQIAKEWSKYEKQVSKLRITPETKPFIEYFNSYAKSELSVKEQTPCELIPILCFDTYSINTIQKCWLEFKLVTPKVFKIKNVGEFLNAFNSNFSYQLGTKTNIFLKDNFYDNISNELIKMINDTYFDEKDIQKLDYKQSIFSSFKKVKRFSLTKSRMTNFFNIMKDTEFEVQCNASKIVLAKCLKQIPEFIMNILPVEGGVSLTFNKGGSEKKYFSLEDTNKYIFYDGNIYEVDTEFANYISPFILYQNNKNSKNSNSISFPETEIVNIFSNIVPKMEKIGQVSIDNSLTNNYVRHPLEIKLYFDKFQKGISAKIEFHYDSTIINPYASSEDIQNESNNKILIRNEDEEQVILNIFKFAGFCNNRDFLVLNNEEEVFRFLSDYLPELKEKSEIFYSEDFKNVKIISSCSFKAGVKLNKEGNLLEMKIDYDELKSTDLKEILAAYKIKKKYHRLKNGSFISLESEEIKIFSDIIEQLHITSDQLTNKTIELPKYRALYIDSLAKENSDFSINRAAGFKKMIQDIREPSDIELEVPTDIKGELREYQKTGFKWLKSLSSYGLGGILADDMGLGKTLQVIAFVLSEKKPQGKPSLVIAPTSLVYNWEAEVQKFAPQMNIAIITGAPTERQKNIQNIVDADLIVTSYGMIKKDIEVYSAIKFKYCFIDEAQHIKNPNTLNAKSVKKIKAEGYFALTGTPIENSLTELWSIFDFLMPAYLSSHTKFVNRFEAPIVKNKDAKAMETLRRHIQPFILRRMKKDVLKELPPKIESKVTNDMTVEQRKIYIAYMKEAKKTIDIEIKQNGFEKSQIKILSLLTRLRQICCHPSTFIENYTGGSGKLEILNELLEDIIDSGHRVLIFSQFTSMLAIIKTELESSNIGYHYLDGSTSSKERLRLVNTFNGGENKVFLLSIKAGGVGLNLTGADVVIHFDPWWNPAVEDQASDRAYRIGQKNSVSVYKLITKNTIEEKIFELQLRKKELINSVIKPGENLLTKMSQDEIKSLFDFSEN